MWLGTKVKKLPIYYMWEIPQFIQSKVWQEWPAVLGPPACDLPTRSIDPPLGSYEGQPSAWKHWLADTVYRLPDHPVDRCRRHRPRQD